MANIAYFEIPADNVDRAKHFYHSLLGWQIEPTKAPASPAMVAPQYRDITTGPAEEGKLNMGGLYRRQSNETIKSYVMVEDLEKVLGKVEALGGEVLLSKEEIPGVGKIAIIQDTEGNSIGLWKPLK